MGRIEGEKAALVLCRAQNHLEDGQHILLVFQPSSLPALTKDARFTRDNGHRFFWNEKSDNDGQYGAKEEFKDAIRDIVLRTKSFCMNSLWWHGG